VVTIAHDLETGEFNHEQKEATQAEAANRIAKGSDCIKENNDEDGTYSFIFSFGVCDDLLRGVTGYGWFGHASGREFD
jgi:hypothetical protein